jgi:cytidylate kinase
VTTLPQIWIITGLMAAGKSTIAQALAERLPRSVHLRGDAFRKMIVRGREDMTVQASAEALAQLKLRHRLACDVAITYASAGFVAVYQDVILGAYLSEIAAWLSPLDTGIVVLNPSLDVLAEHDRARTKTAYGPTWTPQALSDGLATMPQFGLWLDSSELSISQTVDRILAAPDVARRR